MVEAMICGAVPVVANVGDLGDVVSDGENGFLIEPGNIEQFADRAVAILSDEERRRRFSAAAARTARAYNGLERVSGLWREHLGALRDGSAQATMPAAQAGAGTLIGRPSPAWKDDGR